jgi:hypothetical protein
MSQFFDDDFPPGEQIPRRMQITLRPQPGPYGDVVRMTINGLGVGDPLTDNAWGETGYRWHDTLHLAHAVCLGWSPALRALARLKRRSDPRVDHVEDGGRAVVADEAIAWTVFCHARQRHWDDATTDSGLLDHVQQLTYALEVATRTRQEWAHAIRTGLVCFRAVWEHNGGVLLGDVATRTLTFQSPLTPAPARSVRQEAPTSAGTGSRSGTASAGTPA